MHRFQTLAGTLLFALAPLSTAHAGVLAFDFRNDTSWGRILLDSGVADTAPDPRKGRYMNSVVGYSLHITGIRNGDAPTETFFEGSTGSFVPGFQADGVGACGFKADCAAFTFDCAVGTFTKNAIPVGLSAAAPSIFLTPTWQTYLGPDVHTTIAPVPEPATWATLLLGAGLAGLSRRRVR